MIQHVIRIHKFLRRAPKSLQVRAHYFEVSARKRARPGRTRPKRFEIVQHLARQGQQGAHGFAPLHPQGEEHLRGCFLDGENMAGGHCRSRMIQKLLVPGDAHGHSAEITRDSARHSHRLRLAFNREDPSFERRNRDAAEGLEWMHRPNRRTLDSQGFERTRVHCAASMQDNPSAQFFFANPGELSRRKGDFIIRRGNQDDPRQQDLPRHSRESLPCPNESNGAPRAGFAAGQNRANPPPRFTQLASQRTSHSSRTDDGQATWHAMFRIT